MSDEFFAYAAAVLVGVLAVLIGAGGSILTVPILVYLLGIPPVIATGYSLLIIGITNLLSAIGYIRRSLVNFRLVLLFGVPSTIGVYMTRKYLVPAIPDQMFDFNELLLTKDIFLMLLLSVLIFISAIIMIIVKRKYKTEDSNKTLNLYLPWMVLVEGLLIGALTGTVGIGGGFLIIPALVLLCKQPIKIAIGSSLLIIVLQSGFGFLGEWGNNLNIDYFLIAKFTGFAISGVAIGMLVSIRVSGYKLRNAFGYILLAIGAFIVIVELLKM